MYDLSWCTYCYKLKDVQFVAGRYVCDECLVPDLPPPEPQLQTHSALYNCQKWADGGFYLNLHGPWYRHQNAKKKWEREMLKRRGRVERVMEPDFDGD